MNKLRNKKVVVDGIKFDSRKEAKRYAELKLLERAGEISNLTLQPKYKLIVNDFKVCEYWADFEYSKAGETVTEDVKGYKGGATFALFRVKAKLFRAIYGRDVIII